MAETKKVNLRFKPKGTEHLPAQPVEIDRPGMRGSLPFMPGPVTRDGTERVPDNVRREAQQMLSQPVEIPEEVKRNAERLMAGQRQVVSIDELSPEKQREVLAAIAAAKVPMAPLPQAPQPQQQAPLPQPKFIPAGPGIGQAKMMADRIAAQQEERLRQQQEAASRQPPEPPRVQVPRAPEQAPEPQEQEQESLPQDQAPVKPVTCIHCGWPTDRMDMCNPDLLDKQVFVAAVLGQKRFSKQYGLLGGQLRVVFRSLTVEENDLVVKQLMKDWNDGKISGAAHSVVEAGKYQLALALESIETSVGAITLPTLTDYDADAEPNGTILPQVVEYVNTTAIQNEHTRRIVAKAYGHFIDTQAKLEAMAEQPDFWPATGA